LRVVTGPLVEKLIFESRDDLVTVTVVQMQKDGNIYEIQVNKEVILAAGPTQTLEIRELSGIGNANLLRFYGIEPAIDNPGAGENLQDYGIVSFGYEVADGLPSGHMARDPAVEGAAMAAYQKDGSGPLGMVPLVYAFMPCLDFPLEERVQFIQKFDNDSGEEVSPAEKQ
jgi:choline dehydrogenase-like flavoprotein